MSLTTKRILKELEQLRKDPPSSFVAQFINNNLYEWHFTIRGPENSDYSEGIYHGKIELPVDYPIKPPNIFFFTPNGRFEIKTKICLNITKFHPENWNPSWTIRTMIEGIIQHFHVKDYAVGSISYSSSQIKSLALASHKWECDICGPISELIQPQIKIKTIQIQPAAQSQNQQEEQISSPQIHKGEEIKVQQIQHPAQIEEKEQEKFLNQEIDDPSSEEQEIPINKQKHQEELEKFLWNLLNPEFFAQNNVQIKHFSKQQQQEYHQQQQFQYFDQIYKSMEEEEQVQQTLKVHKTNIDQNNHQENNINNQAHGQNHQSQIMIINIVLITLIVGLVLINFGEYVESQAKEWLLLK